MLMAATLLCFAKAGFMALPAMNEQRDCSHGENILTLKRIILHLVQKMYPLLRFEYCALYLLHINIFIAIKLFVLYFFFYSTLLILTFSSFMIYVFSFSRFIYFAFLFFPNLFCLFVSYPVIMEHFAPFLCFIFF